MKLTVSYRVQNWKQYNQALRNRGNVLIWFTEDALRPPEKSGRGRPREFSTAFIQLALTVRFLFKLPLRATQGLMDSLMKLQGLDIRCCDYSLLSRRAEEIGEMLQRLSRNVGRVQHLVFDSTGLKVYGDGEWKTRIHGASKRRTWRKLHLSIDAETHQIVGYLLTDKATSDGAALPEITKSIHEIGNAYGDGAYDQLNCYEHLWSKGGRPIIPPRRGSNPHRNVWTIPDQLRMLNVQGCHLVGRKSWKVGMGYHRRSLGETAMGRWKITCGGHLQSRTSGNQRAEVAVKVQILNRFTELGMPKTETTKQWVRG